MTTKLHLIDEPELEFGTGKHIDIRYGLRNHGPLDMDDPKAPGVPGEFCTSMNYQRCWYERSLAWREGRSIRRSRS